MKFNIKDFYFKNKQYIVIAASFFAILLTLGFIVDSWILPAIVHSGGSVKVPNVVGNKMEYATAIIDRANLDIEKISEQYSEVVPKGVVINQVPKAGLMVKEGRNVYLTVSKGKETVKMPFLIGQSIWTARRTLQTAGLTVGDVSYSASDMYGKDTVIVQSINANQEVVYGQAISIVVSRGSDQQVLMPNLVGLSYSEAQALAIESGLTISDVDSVDNETFIGGTVTNQFPKSGEMTTRSTGIKLTISR